MILLKIHVESNPGERDESSIHTFRGQSSGVFDIYCKSYIRQITLFP